jgi:rhodanese-related sulfurtransferase
MKHSKEFEELCDDARRRITEVTVDDVLAAQKGGEPFHFVDVREDDEWRAGHAAGAVHLGRGVIERDIVGRVPDKNALLILYCGGGFRSALAADSLRKMGYTRAQSMIGGWRAWTERGLPTSKD